MTRLYTIIWTEMATSKQKIVEELSSGPFIFVPHVSNPLASDAVTGFLLSPREAYWHDTTGSIDQIKNFLKSVSVKNHPSVGKMLQNLYPTLHNFFVNECGVDECPTLSDYLQILLHLSNVARPSQASKTVFNVLSKWADGLLCGSLRDDDVDFLRESLLKKESAVLPTELNTWVSLHPSFGLVCWSDDHSLRMQFRIFEGINYIYFADLSDVEKELLQNKIACLFRRLKIPALSDVVYREAIYYGPSDSNLKASLISWALPYAQRYMYYFHRDKYDHLLSTGFENLTQLQIVVVEKLYYRTAIKGCQVVSEKRVMCNCLLEGNTLYTTREADSHSVYMELSSLLFGNAPELHLANFLHMITTMVEAGSSKEQMESFVVNSQKLPKLPDEESIWSLKLPNLLDEEPVMSQETNTLPASDISIKLDEESKMSNAERNPRINTKRPPVDWRLDVGANTSHQNQNSKRPRFYRSLDAEANSYQIQNAFETDAQAEADVAEIEMVSSWNYEQGKGQEQCCSRVLYSSRNVEISGLHQPVYNAAGTTMVNPNENPVFDSSGQFGMVPSADVVVVTENDGSRASINQRYPINQQAVLNGRLGELVAHKYFIERVGVENVNWINEKKETGLPYDLIIGSDEEGNQEYIEVKATNSSSKNWFELSPREWQFATEKGESFSVAHVVLLGNNTAKVTIYKNLVKLSRLNMVRLAVVMFNPYTMSS